MRFRNALRNTQELREHVNSAADGSEVGEMRYAKTGHCATLTPAAASHVERRTTVLINFHIRNALAERKKQQKA